MTPFAIAGIQMHVAAVRENVTAMAHRLDLLMSQFPWVQMVMFSELAPFGPLSSNAQPFPNDTERSFQDLAARHGIWLLPGSMFERIDDRIYNTASVIDPQGQIVGRYRKMFPFRPYEQGVDCGSEFLAFDVPNVGRFGVSICYDIWFPETTRALTSMGVEVLLHPVLTGTIDRDIELSIARASAAMFQCYIFDINGLGPGGVGRSCVVGPNGNVIYQAAGQEEMIPLEIDLEQVRRQREVGLQGLAQTHKSFRDRAVDFTNYDRHNEPAYLHALGPLDLPQRGLPERMAPAPHLVQPLPSRDVGAIEPLLDFHGGAPAATGGPAQPPALPKLHGKRRRAAQ